VPSFSAWSVGALPPGLQPQQHLGPAGPTGAANNLYGLAGHPAQLPPYAASPRYGDVSQLLNSQGMYSPQGALGFSWKDACGAGLSAMCCAKIACNGVRSWNVCGVKHQCGGRLSTNAGPL